MNYHDDENKNGLDFESRLLHSILHGDRSKIISIPKDCYRIMYEYLLDEERYEDLIILESLRSKVSYLNLEDFARVTGKEDEK